MLQETDLPGNQRLAVPGYTLFRFDPSDETSKGGLASLVRCFRPVFKIAITSPLQVLAVGYERRDVSTDTVYRIF